MQVTALVLVIVIDGPLAENIANIERGSGREVFVSHLDAGAWLLVGCVSAAMLMSWLWSGRCALAALPPHAWLLVGCVSAAMLMSWLWSGRCVTAVHFFHGAGIAVTALPPRA